MDQYCSWGPRVAHTIADKKSIQCKLINNTRDKNYKAATSKELRNVGVVRPNETKRNEKSKNLSFEVKEKLQFLTLNNKKAFNHLWQAFIKEFIR